MSPRPRPLEHGDQAHLTWGSLRWRVAGQMRLAASMGGASVQYVDLLAGRDVTLTREQLAAFVHEDDRPANLEEHEAWVLSGDSTLTPAP